MIFAVASKVVLVPWLNRYIPVAGVRAESRYRRSANDRGKEQFSLLYQYLRFPFGTHELANDEEAHLRFYSDFLLYAQGHLTGLLFKIVWRLVTYAALVVVTIDHRHGL